ncbi:tape measure protein, partial [Luteipulveratus sp. YIM 133132]|uniref:tape measure protein n=1 Tax=Luteipulveratus flavus TaxID=3031728 RepID=UPI0023AFC380
MALNVGTLVATLKVDDRQYNQKLTSGESRFSRFSSTVGRGAKFVGGAAVSGLAAIGGVGIATAAKMENAEIAFTTMLGSGAKAQKFLSDLSTFAAKTPFELPELQTAAQSLVSIGIDSSKVIPIMTTLGNVTSGMGTGAEGVKRATVAIQQMNAAGRISGEDLNQLRDAGIPVYELLAKATGKSAAEVANLAQKGKLGKKELGQLMTALESGKGLERFNGMMEKQSQSLSGLWSTLKDTFSVGAAQAIQPLVPLLKDGLAWAIGLVSAQMPRLQAGIADLVAKGPQLEQRFTKIKDAARGLYDLIVNGDYSGRLREAFGWEEDSSQVDQILRLRDAVKGFFDQIRTDGAGTILSSLFTSLGQSAPVLNSALTTTGTVMGFVADHADLIAKAMPFLIAAFASYKVLQAANNTLGRNSVIGFGLQLTATFSLAAANRSLAASHRQLAAAEGQANAATNGGILARGRAAVATWAKTAAERASAAASRVSAAAQWVYNAAVNSSIVTTARSAIATAAKSVAERAAALASRGMAAATWAVTAATNGTLLASGRAAAATVARSVAERAAAIVSRGMAAATWVATAATNGTLLATGRAAAATVAKTIAERAAAVASKGMAAAQWLLNAAMSANPLGLLVIGLVAVGVAIYALWTKSDRFRSIITGTWNAISGAVSGLLGWLKRNWPLLLGIITGPLGPIVYWVAKHWSTVTGKFSAAWNWVTGVFRRTWSGILGVVT